MSVARCERASERKPAIVISNCVSLFGLSLKEPSVLYRLLYMHGRLEFDCRILILVQMSNWDDGVGTYGYLR